MRSFLAPRAVAAYAALAALAALSACSDTTAPRSLRSAEGSPAFDLGPTPNVGPVQVNLASSTATQYCGYSATLNATFADGACVASFNLQTALGTYNPGWSANMGASAWIGSQADANYYTVAPGTYKFNTTFNVAAGATSPVLNVTTLSDNLVAVYLNGVLLGQQAVTDCLAFPCNWQNAFTTSLASNFVIGGSNTLTIYLTDTPIGYGKPGAVAPNYFCQTEGPQQYGQAGFGGAFNVLTPQYTAYHSNPPTWDYVTCLNPAGLDFVGTVSWVPPVVKQWCSPGFWKNHLDAWSLADKNKLYSTLIGAAPLKAGSPSNPTLLQVVSNPSVYGGPATNSVADYLSGVAFGTHAGTKADDANCNDGVLLVS